MNIGLILMENIPSRIEEATAERDKLVERIKALNVEIATLMTHLQVGGGTNVPEIPGERNSV